MAKDDDLPTRIEAVFERTGLGNLYPEKLEEHREMHQKAMAHADHMRAQKGKSFEEILEAAPEAKPEEP